MSRRPGHVTTGPYAPPVPRTTLTVTSADGARLYAEVHGPEDAPAVVLAHGWTCSTAFWAPVVRDLAASTTRSSSTTSAATAAAPPPVRPTTAPMRSPTTWWPYWRPPCGRANAPWSAATPWAV